MNKFKPKRKPTPQTTTQRSTSTTKTASEGIQKQGVIKDDLPSKSASGILQAAANLFRSTPNSDDKQAELGLSDASGKLE